MFVPAIGRLYLAGLLLLALPLLLAYFALVMLPVDTHSQAALAWSLVLVLIGLRYCREYGLVRVLVLLLAAFVTLRYLWWRVTETLGWHDWFSYLAALILLGAEIYGVCVYFLGMFVNVQPLRREVEPLEGDPGQWPTVDIFIPTYNEEESLLRMTVMAATQIRYPRARMHVYLCDDGGTDQKCNDTDPVRAAAARARRQSLLELAEELGASYVTRARNLHAKAGNINSALEKSHGELVLILDADHVPTVDFLEKTVGFFQKDPRLFLVQTPHFFINPDPLEKNLELFGEIPSENEMFYGVIQEGLDFWQGTFFCGSAALLRRSALEEVGGLAGQSITEDAEAALDLHSRGYHSVYLNHPLISGLQPETYSSFVVQRVRWAQGMVQIFMLKNPVLKKGLSLSQRMTYLSSSFFWFFPFARMVFLLAPVAYLVFGLHVYDANMTQVFAYTLPHIVASIIVANFLFGHVRWPFVSELYEVLQGMYAFNGIVKTIANPWAPSFNVTPKGEHLDQDFVSSLSGPFYLIYAITVAALMVGVWRWFEHPMDRGITSVTFLWETLNLVLLTAAVAVLYERRQRRITPRMPADLPAALVKGEADALAGRLTDLSSGGGFLVVNASPGSMLPERGDICQLRAHCVAKGEDVHLHASIQARRNLADGQVGFGLHFVPATLEEERDVMYLVHGDSERWKRFMNGRRRQIGAFRALHFLVTIGGRHFAANYGAFLRDAARYVTLLPVLVFSTVGHRLLNLVIPRKSKT